MVKNPPANAGDTGDIGLIPRLERFPGRGNGSLLQYTCLENPMDRGAWWATVHGVAKSQTRLSDFTTSLSLFTFMHWRRKWQPTPVFLPGESRDGGAWRAAVYGVAQSGTLLKRLSSSSSREHLAMMGDIFVVTNGRVLLAPSG